MCNDGFQNSLLPCFCKIFLLLSIMPMINGHELHIFRFSLKNMKFSACFCEPFSVLQFLQPTLLKGVKAATFSMKIVSSEATYNSKNAFRKPH